MVERGVWVISVSNGILLIVFIQFVHIPTGNIIINVFRYTIHLFVISYYPIIITGLPTKMVSIVACQMTDTGLNTPDNRP